MEKAASDYFRSMKPSAQLTALSDPICLSLEDRKELLFSLPFHKRAQLLFAASLIGPEKKAFLKQLSQK